LQGHRPAVVDVPLTRGQPVSFPPSPDIRPYIYHTAERLSGRSTEEAREGGGCEDCEEGERERDRKECKECKERCFGRQFTASSGQPHSAIWRCGSDTTIFRTCCYPRFVHCPVPSHRALHSLQVLAGRLLYIRSTY